MALKVIGAGFGRTGTLSLKLALEELGFGPCHHMAEVFAHPETVPVWHEAALGRPVDWDALFEGFQAMVDWPGCAFWRELAIRYPEAKVLLTVRDADHWWESASSTIFKAMEMGLKADDPFLRSHSEMAHLLIREGTFNGSFDRDVCVAEFERHVAWVKATVPPERLIVYEVGSGWEPLCEGLGVPVPSTPYPKVNSREQFWDRKSQSPDT